MIGDMAQSAGPINGRDAIIINTSADVARALDQLLVQDCRLRPLFELAGELPLRRRSGGLQALLHIIAQQQISLTAADAIWNRFKARCIEVTPLEVLRLDDRGWVEIGMSRAKIRTFRAVCEAIEAGQLDLSALTELDDQQALGALTKITGIGPWTAEVYLLSCLGRADIWPAGDVALQTAVGHGLGLAERPQKEAMIRLAQPWRPYRAVAARLFWQYYRKIPK